MDLETQKGEEDSEDSVKKFNPVLLLKIEIGKNENWSGGSAASEKSEDEHEAKAPFGEAEKKGTKAEAAAETEKEEYVIEVKRNGRSTGAGGSLRVEKVTWHDAFTSFCVHT
ncbi:hypothetical protein U1Q18_029823 [Sarracenia purpurea var. burkii]